MVTRVRRRFSGLYATSLVFVAALMFVQACDQPSTKSSTTSASSASSAPSSASSAPAVASASPGESHGLPDANMTRDQIPSKYKWKLAPIFASDSAFEKELKAVNADRGKLNVCDKSLDDPGTLFSCLDTYFKLRLRTNKLTLYANMRLDSHQKDSKIQSMNDRALRAMNKLMARSSKIRRGVLALTDEQLASSYHAEPKLGGYKPYVDGLRRRKAHVFDAKTEQVLTLAGDNLWAEIDLNELPSDHEKTFKGLMADMKLPKVKDEKGKEVQLSLSSYGKYRSSADRRVRKDTVESFFKTLRGEQDAFAGALGGQVRFNVFLARARGYDTALDAYLDKDNIDPQVYRNLITTIHHNLAPLHRYVRLRKKVMGLKQLHIYDLYTPMVKRVDKKIPYEEALKILPKALAPLGDDYLAVLREGLKPENGWVDVYPHKGKESGAFSSSVYGVHPFVKVNYYDQIDDVSTLAHEFGHALHSYLAMKNQPYVTSSYVPFIAEIASTLNEKLLSDYLLAHATSDAERLYLLNELVERIRTTIYRQALFAEFELAIHTAAEKGTPLTPAFMDKTYARLVRTYYGPDFTVGKNDGVEWSYIPHFYYKYYVFTYATGLSSGIALADHINKGGKKERDAYLGMLKGGRSRPPLELLKGAGVDLTKPDAIVSAAVLLDKSLSEMEQLMGKASGGKKK